MRFVSSLRPPLLLWLPALAYLLVAAFVDHRGDDLTGDEPYYLQIAESIVNDADVNLENNHEHVGSLPGDTHCVLREHGCFSVHNLGLPGLIALPWALVGTLGARLFVALCTGLAALLLYQVINAIWQQPRGSLTMALALALGMPLVHASSQIYPDLPAGILLLFLAGKAIRAETEPAALAWRDLMPPLALAFLPWLHIKYAAPALVACGWYAMIGRWQRWSLNAAALIASLALLGCYNWYAFGRPTGPYARGHALSAELNSLIVFMGLHFDQAQGMFLQQPLWLLGLIGLAPMWRSSWMTCSFWILLYAAAIVPNAMHINWYGGGSFIGRFGATAVLLWAIPLAYAARRLSVADRRAPAVLALASLALQFCLAYNWLTGGKNLLNHCERPQLWQACVWSYNGFFPTWLRDYLPYWQPFAEFWHHPANFSALIMAGGLLLCGFCLPRWSRLAWGCVAGASLSAVLLAVAVPPKQSLAVCTGDQLPEFAGIVGHRANSERVANEGVDAAGPLAMAYDFFPRPGDYRVVVDFQAQGTTDPVGHVMFHNGKTLAMLSTLTGEAGQRQNVSLVHVPRCEAGSPSTIVLWYTGRGTLSIARLEVEHRVR